VVVVHAVEHGVVWRVVQVNWVLLKVEVTVQLG
jgi:hypothetical protein